ncbi:prepilin-type N-terminal cleavage/methylation domain-containing protein [Victivallis lenta]|uniref:prepilin-type N-terminal cleavage/methylation domain-containing protein n=1 Tax=Victivallis lenta TaxID=2606640 RepID=UPI003AB33E8D
MVIKIRERSFTLIEFLIVIAILALMLLPVQNLAGRGRRVFRVSASEVARQLSKASMARTNTE